MNDAEFADLSDSQLEQIDTYCDQFLSACKAGTETTIEHYLELAGNEIRPALFRELLVTELGFLSKVGHAPALRTYASRFPHYQQTIEQAFSVHLPAGHHDPTYVAAGGNTDALPDRARDANNPPQKNKSDKLDGMPRQIDKYQLLKLLGRGGMGAVYLAHDSQLDRQVALKVPEFLWNPENAEALTERFYREARAMATVDHPNLCPIYDIGECNGRPFLTMAYIEGKSLAQFTTTSAPLPVDEVVRIVRTLAQAMHSAHEVGIVHRDLKPANIMVDDHGKLFITDFGLAKQMGAEHEQTRTGTVMGTLSYIAPEQASGQTSDVGTLADVYSLGAVMYFLLTGSPPIQGSSPMETMLLVREQTPRIPSELLPQIPRDVETICLKCLEKEPRRRYQSAAELAEDLGRFARHEPIRARHVNVLQRSWRWCRRNPILASLGSSLAIVVLIALAIFAWQQSNLVTVNQKLVATNESLVQTQGEVEDQRDKFRWREAELAYSKGRELAEAGEISQGLVWMTESLSSATKERPEFHRVVRTNIAAWSQLLSQQTYTSPRLHGEYSDDGSSLVVTDYAGKVNELDPQTGVVLSELVDFEAKAHCLALHPSKPVLAIGLSTPTGPVVRIWDYNKNESVCADLPHERALANLRFTKDGHRLITHHEGPTSVRLWNVDDGKLLVGPRQPQSATVEQIRLSHDGKQLLLVGSGKSEVWDAETFTLLALELQLQPDEWVADFHPDGNGVLTQRLSENRDHSIFRLVGSGSGREEIRIQVPQFSRSNAFLSPDGRVLVTMGPNDAIQLFDIFTGQPVGPQQYRLTTVRQISPDGRSLLAHNGVLEIGKSLSRAHRSFTHATRLASAGGFWQEHRRDTSIAYDSARSTVVTCPTGAQTGAASARLWDIDSGQPQGPPLRHRVNHLRAVDVSPDGELVATGGHVSGVFAAEVALWTTNDNTQKFGWEFANTVSVLKFCPNGRLLAVGDYNGHVTLFDTSNGRPVGNPLEHPEIVWSLEFSSNGEMLAVGTTPDRTGGPHVQVWNVADGEPLYPPLPHGKYVEFIQFSHDDQFLLTGDRQNARLWRANNGLALWESPPQAKALQCLALHPEKLTFAVSSGDGNIRLYHGEDGVTAGRVMHHPHPVHAVAFSPNGQLLAAGSADGGVRIWDVATTQPLGPPLMQTKAVNGVAFSSDSRHVISTAADGSTRKWPIPQPAKSDQRKLERQIAILTGLQLDSNRDLQVLDDDTWQKLYRSLKKRELPDGLHTPASIADWHEAQVRDAEQDLDSFGTIWHLDRLAKIRTDDWLNATRRARANAWAGRMQQSQAEYERARLLLPEDTANALTNRFAHAVLDCQANEKWELVVWYLDRLIDINPGKWELYVERVHAHMQLKQPELQSADFVQALHLSQETRLFPRLSDAFVVQGLHSNLRDVYSKGAEVGHLSLNDWWRFAALELQLDNVPGYLRICQTMRQQIGQQTVPPALVPSLIDLFTVGPASEEDIAFALKLMDALPQESQLAGRLYYRADRFGEAIRLLNSTEKDSAAYRLNLLYLALAQRSHGDSKGAQQSLQRFENEQATASSPWLELHIGLLMSELSRDTEPVECHAD